MGALPIIYITLITICYLSAIPSGFYVLWKQRATAAHESASPPPISGESNYLADTDAEIFAS